MAVVFALFETFRRSQKTHNSTTMTNLYIAKPDTRVNALYESKIKHNSASATQGTQGKQILNTR